MGNRRMECSPCWSRSYERWWLHKQSLTAPTPPPPPSHIPPFHAQTVATAAVHHPVTHPSPVPWTRRPEDPPSQQSSSTSHNEAPLLVEMTSLPDMAPKKQRTPSQPRKVTQSIRPLPTCPIQQNELLLSDENNAHFSSTQLTDPSVSIPEERSSVSRPLPPSSPVLMDSLLDFNEEELSGILVKEKVMMPPQMGPSKKSTGQQTCKMKLDISQSVSFEDDVTPDTPSPSSSLMTKPYKHINTDRKSKHWTLEIKHTRLIIEMTTCPRSHRHLFQICRLIAFQVQPFVMSMVSCRN